MNSDSLLKNIELSTALDMVDLIQYQPGQMISRTLAQGQSLSLTLVAFDESEETGPHMSPGDAMAYILDGRADITIGDVHHVVGKGKVIVMPAGVPHAIRAEERFKMLLVVVFPIE